MSKILVVFGSTGQQGGSVIETVLDNSALSSQYSIRAVTRDPSNAAAQALKAKGVHVVAGDLKDASSLGSVMKGAHSVFLITGASFSDNTWESEMAEGKVATDAAIAAGVEYLIYSTLPRTKAISGGKYTGIVHFDIKADIEDYIKARPIRSAFFAPGSFMSNYEQITAPRPAGEGTYNYTSCVSPDTQLPLIDTARDTGKYVGAILADLDKYEGKTFSAATKLYTMTEIAQIMSESSGKTVRYNQIPGDVFSSFIPGGRGEELVQMFSYFQHFGYYGPKSKQLVEWASTNALQPPTTLEEYLKRKPLALN